MTLCEIGGKNNTYGKPVANQQFLATKSMVSYGPLWHCRGVARGALPCPARGALPCPGAPLPCPGRPARGTLPCPGRPFPARGVLALPGAPCLGTLPCPGAPLPCPGTLPCLWWWKCIGYVLVEGHRIYILYVCTNLCYNAINCIY